MGAKYKHNRVGFRRAVLQATWLEEDLVGRALNVQANAEFLASEHVVTGQFAASYVTESGTNGGGRKHDRAFARVRNVDPKAVSIELGHDVPDGLPRKGKRRDAAPPRKHVEGLHTLTRSLDAAGD